MDGEPSPERRTRAARFGVVTIFCASAVLNVAIRLLNLPLNRIIESRYCTDYYLDHDPTILGPDGSVPEHLCKINEVQGELGWLEGAISTSIIVRGESRPLSLAKYPYSVSCLQCPVYLIVTIPFGSISDHLSRRTVMFLNVLASTVMFGWFLFVGKVSVIPVEAMVAAPFLALFGGGECVLTSTILAFLTDFAPDLPTRTTYISYVVSLQNFVSLFGPIIAATTMTVSLWLPFYIGLGLQIAALLIVALLPRSSESAADLKPYPNDPTGAEEGTETSPLLNESSSQDAPADASPTSGPLRGLRSELKDTFNLVIRRVHFQQLLLATLVMGIAGSNISVFILYMSKRYNKTFAEVGYFLSLKAGVAVFVGALVIPFLFKPWLDRHPEMQIAGNFIGLETSLLACCVGALTLAVAGSIPFAIIAIIIYAAGSATPAFVFSLAKSPVVSLEDDRATGREYSIMVMARTIGTLIGTPLMTAAWVKGLSVGGAQLGLPFFIAAVFFLVILGIIANLHARWRKRD